MAKLPSDWLVASGCVWYRSDCVNFQTCRANWFASCFHQSLVPGSAWVVVGVDSFGKGFRNPIFSGGGSCDRTDFSASLSFQMSKVGTTDFVWVGRMIQPTPTGHAAKRAQSVVFALAHFSQCGAL